MVKKCELVFTDFLFKDIENILIFNIISYVVYKSNYAMKIKSWLVFDFVLFMIYWLFYYNIDSNFGITLFNNKTLWTIAFRFFIFHETSYSDFSRFMKWAITSMYIIKNFQVHSKYLCYYLFLTFHFVRNIILKNNQKYYLYFILLYLYLSIIFIKNWF